MVCASLCLSGDQRRVRERKKLRMVKREILRDIESDDKEETQRKRERERENKREKGWQVGLVLFLAARIQVQNPPPPLLVLCVLRRLSPRLRAWNGEE